MVPLLLPLHTHPRFSPPHIAILIIPFLEQVYPTSMRGVGLGAAYSIARVAGVGTPYIVRVLADISVSIPIIIFTCFCIIATAVALLLPIETFNRGLQDTLDSPPAAAATTHSTKEEDTEPLAGGRDSESSSDLDSEEGDTYPLRPIEQQRIE